MHICHSSLTVEEHLFFGQLKGMSYIEAKSSIPGQDDIIVLYMNDIFSIHSIGGSRRLIC